MVRVQTHWFIVLRESLKETWNKFVSLWKYAMNRISHCGAKEWSELERVCFWDIAAAIWWTFDRAICGVNRHQFIHSHIYRKSAAPSIDIHHVARTINGSVSGAGWPFIQKLHSKYFSSNRSRSTWVLINSPPFDASPSLRQIAEVAIMHLTARILDTNNYRR